MRVVLLLLAVVAGSALVGATSAPAVADNPLCSSVSSDSAPDAVTFGSGPLGQLDVREAQRLVERTAPDGPPVRVAVLDSGVDDTHIPVVARHSAAGGGAVTFFHGTAVAGLVAGQPRDDGTEVGIAPDAQVVDVRVYDGVDDEDGEPLTPDGLAAGLEWVSTHAGDLGIRVANVSLAVDPSPRLERAVRAVQRAGVVVVAAAGNRPQEGEPFDEDFADDAASAGEDAAGVLYPTSYPGVVSVSSTADGSGATDATQYVLRNSRTTVAVPTFDAVSYGLDGRPCVLEPLATSWAAAEVSGVLALLFQLHPDDNAQQAVARLVNTANGTTDLAAPLVGAGVVQPLEALTRPLDPARDGAVERTVAAPHDSAPATAPEPPDDLLAATRDDAVWWGLVGGGVLVIALLLRPVLARRRR
ncbi:MAG: S8 family serine peptidase [Nocardioides sp.]|nr:S8 family serine peptidase [Nocardioidaceae bacterium]MCB8955378.1 S8 family serine peptidase [Nocardioides sp.]